MQGESINARVWLSESTDYVFPEQLLPKDRRPAKIAVCISGGGSRSQSAAMGQLRGLLACGILSKVGYLSCVSGGSWASVPYTYYRSGPADDEQLLGPAIAPRDITPTTLTTLPDTRLAIGSTQDFEAVLKHELEHNPDSHDAWITAVGRVFLRPFGLYSENSSQAFFTLDVATADAIKARNVGNPGIQNADFLTVRSDLGSRPYLVVNSCIIWPTGLFNIEDKHLVGFEYTPLYIGDPRYQRLREKHFFKHERRYVGGGYIEPFAFGCQNPGAQLAGAPPGAHDVRVTSASKPYSLIDAAGTSSAAFSADTTDITDRVSPQVFYWPLSSAGNTEKDNAGEVTTYGDGGNLENQGLVAMLRRGVDRAIVFVNTNTKINVDYDPEKAPKASDFDASVARLFGFHKTKHYDNQVFTAADWESLVSRMIAIKKQPQNGPLAVLTEFTVQPNAWWGIPAPFQSTILWVYNERVQAWEEQLPQATRDWMKIGERHSQFDDFPNYKTIGQDAHGLRFPLVQLTAAQVNAIADLSCWNIQQLWDQGLIQKVLA